MKISTALGLTTTLALLAACGGTDGGSGSARIDPTVAGTWVKIKKSGSLSDTLIMTDSKYQTPYASGAGAKFWAADGVAEHGPDRIPCGEYVLSGDTLYFEGLLGDDPDGVVNKATVPAYLRAGSK